MKRNENGYAGKKFISKLSDEITGYMTLIEIQSDRELIISGCRGVMEYDCQSLVLDTISGVVKICGYNLCLSVFQGDVLIICGKIKSVCLEDYD